MAKAILDLFIEQGYEYPLNINVNTPAGADLENDYSCFFECDSIGKLQFAVVGDRYELTLSVVNTNKLTKSLEGYVVYLIKTADGSYSKLLSGRIHVDKKVRA